MIIWNGLGFLVAVFVFVSSLSAQFITESFLGEGYWDRYKWPFGLSLMVAATGSWFLGRFLARRKVRTVIDKETGKEFVLPEKHALFFIDMRWWGPILALIGAIVIVLDLVPNG